MFEYLKEYSNFETVEEMDRHVDAHKYYNWDKLNKSSIEVLRFISRHSLRYPGASHLKLDTLIKETGYSLATVKRCTKKLCDLGIIKKISTRKNGGVKGANIYSISLCHKKSELLVEPLIETKELSSCDIKVIPNESKSEVTILEAQSLILLSSSKSLKHKNNINIKNESFSFDVLKEIPKCVKNVVEGLDFTNEEIKKISDTVLSAKKSVDKLISLEDYQKEYEDVISKTIKSYNDAKSKGLALELHTILFNAVKDKTSVIVQPKTKKPVKSSYKPFNSKRKNVRTEYLPDWFEKVGERNSSKEEEQKPVDFELQVKQTLERLAALQN